MKFFWGPKRPWDESWFGIDLTDDLTGGQVSFPPDVEGAEESIQSVNWIVPEGLVKDDTKTGVVDNYAVVYLSGGTANRDYNVVAQVTFTSGWKQEYLVTLPVRNY